MSAFSAEDVALARRLVEHLSTTPEAERPIAIAAELASAYARGREDENALVGMMRERARQTTEADAWTAFAVASLARIPTGALGLVPGGWEDGLSSAAARVADRLVALRRTAPERVDLLVLAIANEAARERRKEKEHGR